MKALSLMLDMLSVTSFHRNAKWTPVALRTSGPIVRITEISQGVEISVSSCVTRIMRKQHKLFTVVG